MWLVVVAVVLLIIVIAVLKIETVRNIKVPIKQLSLKQDYQLKAEKILNEFLTNQISAEDALDLVMDLKLTGELKELHLKLVLALNAADVNQVKFLLAEIEKL